MDTRLINSKNLKAWIGTGGAFPTIYMGFMCILQVIIAQEELKMKIAFTAMFALGYAGGYIYFYLSKKNTVVRINDYITNQKIDSSKIVDKSSKNYSCYIQSYPVENYLNRVNKLMEDKDSIYKNEANTSVKVIDRVVDNIDIPINNIVDLSNKKNQNKDLLETIEKEAYNVKDILEKLIEASKLSSNVVEFKLEDTDISFLLKQKVLDFQDDIKESNLELISNIAEEYVMKLDGEKISKSLDIYLLNIINYAQANTRVYVDTKHTENTFSIVIKNISKDKLNMNYSEFTSSKGGLSIEIAKALIEGQGGKVSISIDGDLFKVEIVLHKGE